jgi:hypothetical protein
MGNLGGFASPSAPASRPATLRFARPRQTLPRGFAAGEGEGEARGGGRVGRQVPRAGRLRTRLTLLALPPAVLGQEGELLGRRADEADAGATESPGPPIPNHQAIDVDGGLDAREIEGQGNRRLWQHGHVTRPAQGDSARTDILGLAKVQASADRVANRADHRHSPTLATISFRPAALWVHARMVGNLAAHRKFSIDRELLRNRTSRASIAG